ncbi:hypothetical protein SAMN05192529_102135 [Arachidicoccus rhizosphaerae]|uniref:Uncharacterized protein n=1 Tax=Arachidicoccus rhizosphaerae TaxID=551991 RepID=A0A1H3W4Y2_9BACT|nr:hypothetical protein [Arachidicoccus rhizosphaerae]SDZ82116.1 hypothetical protein SAMN05192529_102135 [Arachidicoccus rhizosphaerae]
MADNRISADLEVNVTGVTAGASKAVSSLQAIQAEMVKTQKAIGEATDGTSVDRLSAKLANLQRNFNVLSGKGGVSGIAAPIKDAATATEGLTQGMTNVGNGSKALSQLMNRNLHGVAELFISPGRAALILANDLPQLINRYRELSAANKEIAASGGKAASSASILKAAFDPLNLAIGLGIAVLIKYGGEIYNWATGAEEAKKKAEALKKEQESLDSAFKRGASSVTDNIATVRALVAAMTDESVAQDVRLSKYNQLITLYPQLAKNLDGQKDKIRSLADVINHDLIPALRNQAIAEGFAAQAQQQASKEAELIAQQPELFRKAVAAKKEYLKAGGTGDNVQDVYNYFNGKTDKDLHLLKKASDDATKAYSDNVKEAKKMELGIDGLFKSQIKYRNEVDKSILGSQTYKQKLEEQLKEARAVRDNIEDSSSPAFQKQQKIIDGLNDKLKVYNDRVANTPKAKKTDTEKLSDELDKISRSKEDLDRQFQGGVIDNIEYSTKQVSLLSNAISTLHIRFKQPFDSTAIKDLQKQLYIAQSTVPVSLISFKGNPEAKNLSEQMAAVYKDANELAIKEYRQYKSGKGGDIADLLGTDKANLVQQLRQVGVNSVMSQHIKVPVSLDVPEADLKKALDEYRERLDNLSTAATEITKELGINLVESVGQALGSGDWKGLGAEFLAGLGNAIESFGKELVAQATVFATLKEAFEAAIKSINPWAAVGIGVAMIAVGAALQSFAHKGLGGASGGSSSVGSNITPQNNFYAPSSPSYSGTSASYSGGDSVSGGLANQIKEIPVNVTVDGKIENNVIRLANIKAQNDYDR